MPHPEDYEREQEAEDYEREQEADTVSALPPTGTLVDDYGYIPF